MNNKKKLKNDIILAVVVIAIAATGLLLLNIFKTEGAFAVIKIDGKETERYPLSVNTVVVIETGDDGRNILVIADNKAFMKDANCPEKAITVVDNLARIDYDKCTGCRLCEENCPTKCLKPIDFANNKIG